MPRKGYKAITIREEIFKQAQQACKDEKIKDDKGNPVRSISNLTETAILEKIKETSP